MTALVIGLAGLGTVGAGVASLLEKNADLYRKRCGAAIRIASISARNKHKARPFDTSAMTWEENPLALAENPDISMIVEAVGGADGVALDLCKKALQRGKHVVTANKAMIAEHGGELAALAQKNGVVLAYEAAVAGGIPIIKTLREALAANRFTRIYGLLNGTCNYMLHQMESGAGDFAAALKDAQRLGYAEADPSADVDGLDAAHKLAILSAVAFGGAPDMAGIDITGIRRVSAEDFIAAKQLGGTLKLVACAAKGAGGRLERAVYPAFVPLASDMAQVKGADNAVFIEGEAVGSLSLKGPGAGMYETASSIIADIIDVARGYRYPAFTEKESDTETGAAPCAPHNKRFARFSLAEAARLGVTSAAHSSAIFHADGEDRLAAIIGANIAAPAHSYAICDYA